jgi:hypothetical protein
MKKTFQQFWEEVPANNIGAGKIAGSPEADPGNPPVRKKKRKKYASLGCGSRKRWMV